MRKEEKVGEETVKFVMEKLQVIADGLNFSWNYPLGLFGDNLKNCAYIPSLSLETIQRQAGQILLSLLDG